MTAPDHPVRRYRWWHAAAVGGLANLASALPAGFSGDTSFYEELRTPPGSPPGWLFAPVWGINNLLTLAGDLRVANLPTGTPGRSEIMVSEALGWGLFASFSGLCFGLRSPVLGAADTVLGLAVAVHAVTATAKVDRTAAWLFAPRLAWLGYAAYVSVGTAIKSPDRLLGLAPRQT